MINILSLMTLIMMIMLMIYLMMMKKKYNMTNSMNPFECGFSNKLNKMMPFSIQFFIISLMFLIFDMEISILITMIPALNNLNNKNIAFIATIFLISMFLTLILEWKINAMKWSTQEHKGK